MDLAVPHAPPKMVEGLKAEEEEWDQTNSLASERYKNLNALGKAEYKKAWADYTEQVKVHNQATVKDKPPPEAPDDINYAEWAEANPYFRFSRENDVFSNITGWSRLVTATDSFASRFTSVLEKGSREL